jgi:proprotein convertase subtilisin/kexin type 5
MNNNQIYSYNLIKSAYSVIHSFKIFDETKETFAPSSCAEWVFFLMAIQKDCDQYKLTISLRFPGTNQAFKYEKGLNASVVENLVVNYNNNNNFAQLTFSRYSKDFYYNFDNELSLMFSPGLFPDSFVKPCPIPPPNCNYTNINGLCVSCQSPFVMLTNYTCAANCTDGFYNSTGYCKNCHDNCKTCFGPNNGQCIWCKDKFYLNKASCDPTCPPETWPIVDANTNYCKVCQQNCAKCENANDCIDCTSNTFLYNKTCYTDCPKSTYKDVVSKKCAPCSSHCEYCTNGETCTGCENGYYLKNGICFNVCGDQYFANNQTRTCDKCLTGCKECINSVNCITCDSDKVNVKNITCDGKCPDGMTSIKSFCLACLTPNCKSCPNQKDCDTCQTGYYLKENQCVTSCGSGWYLDAARGVCVKCVNGCDTCDANTCSKCVPPKLLIDKTKCEEACPDGYTKVGGDRCEKCTNTKCKDCLENNLGTCKTCYTGTFLYKGDCVTKCPNGTFPVDGFCNDCMEGCDNCVNLISCNDCNKDYLKQYKSGNCVKNCTVGWTETSINNTRYCVPCDDGFCSKCDGTNTKNCNECKSPYKLYNMKCYDPCPNATYATLNNTCNNCKYKCVKCNNGLDCQQCEPPFVLNNNECVEKCNDGSIPVDGKCTPCDNKSCKTCAQTDLGKCTNCTFGKFLYGRDCVSPCPNQTYPMNDQCFDCVLPCTRCSSASNCSQCASPFTLAPDRTCQDDCPLSYVNVGGICKKCPDDGCDKCNSTTIEECIKCNSTLFLYNGDCIKQCPERFFSKDGSCYNCLASCLNCQNSTSCDTCETGKFNYLKKECRNECPDGYVADTKANCQPCNIKCKKCNPENTEVCNKCYDPKVLYNGDCLTECPLKTYQASDNSCKRN